MSGTRGVINPLTPGQVWDCELLTDSVPAKRVGAAIQISATGAGTVTLTLASGNTIVVNVNAGDSIYPYQVQMAAAGTATVSAYYNLYV